MRRALIGHTGFVGSNLDAPSFTDRFNSKTISAATGQSFDEVICAGVQAVKWWANQNPEQDWVGIQRLLDVLRTIDARRFVLISTVDVYRAPVGVDESTPISTEGLHAYGLHRYRVEEFVRDRFAGSVIVRLPGLFGKHLKKNLIFDVLEKRDISGFDARSRFQFYDLSRLRSDLDLVVKAGLDLVNVAVAPVGVLAVVETITGQPFDNRTERPPVDYDMRTRHGRVWGKDGPYIETAEDSLARIRAFAANWETA